MFQNSLIVLQQILVMVLLILLGFMLYRTAVLDNHVTKSLTVMLNKYVTPCCILSSYQRPFDGAMMKALGMTFLGAVIIFVISIAIVQLIYRPSRQKNYADCRMCAVLSNNGFMSLPLVNAMFGSSGVLLASAHIVCMATVLWTYGVKTLSGKLENPMRSILVNPGVISGILGIILFCSPIKLPMVLFTAVDYVGSLNTPIAMLVLGCFLAQLDLKACFTDPQIWRISAVRLLLIPLISLFVLLPLPMDMTAKLTLLVGSSAPTAIASAMFAQLFGTDYLFSTRTIALSTLLSVITLPTMIALTEGLSKLL